MPLVGAYSDLLMRNRGGDGIRVSALLALFVPDQYHCIAKAMVKSLREREDSTFAKRYASMLEGLTERKEIVLPKKLKRDCSERALDEENF